MLFFLIITVAVTIGILYILFKNEYINVNIMSVKFNKNMVIVKFKDIDNITAGKKIVIPYYLNYIKDDKSGELIFS